ncbi:MAG: cytidine deaminase [Gemmatimonadetes bacterium]|nr:cytidine deaminase [Gemmatimonadota bacterium]MXX73738.1 cytidine deaminase [Gemmatimonadota bacterium]MYC90023.1 cytidine deaminase [Gemmatimonadota bacterium]MYG35083.1 cytidine deaminase [Gemmatimonadota bacterium]MYJ17247.1 cytidine deaminase [Gemmatimonadota bacterium]
MSVDLLATRARAMLAHAYAPYSRFRVGAALESVTGAVFAGCNVENASYGLTICAERSAVAQAVAGGHRRFRRLVIVTDSDRAVAPCGACCQVVAEFAADTQVFSFGNREEKRWQLTDLLPNAFQLADARDRGGGDK